MDCFFVLLVDELLNSSKLSVVVYSGQLDLIVDTVGRALITSQK